MAKLDALKEKISALKTQLREKLEKIPVFKKLLAPTPAATTPTTTRSNPSSIGRIYQTGGTLTRLQVLALFVFFVGAIVSAAFVGKRLYGRLKSSPQHEKLVEDVSHGMGEIKRRMEENASVLALGKFTSGAYVEEGKKTAMSVDIWVRVSSVEAANFVQKNDVILHDKAMDAIDELFNKKVNWLTEQGKTQAKATLREHLNHAIPKGQVEEIFFHNLVIQ